MTDEELVKYSISQVLSDCRSLLSTLYPYVMKKVHIGIYMPMISYLNLFVYEAKKYVKDKNIEVDDSISNSLFSHLETYRNKSTKLYENMTQRTYYSLERFCEHTKERFLQFYKEDYAANYNIYALDGYPICNFHLLCDKILGFDVGIYNNYAQELEANIFGITSFLASYGHIMPDDIYHCKIQNFDIETYEINTDTEYLNFRVKNKAINLAMMDVLSMLNYYLLVFKNICINYKINLKIEYLLIFYSILSMKSILNFCKGNGISIPYINEFKAYLDDLENKYIRNKVRKVCIHYDYSLIGTIFTCDPIIETFEEVFNNDIDSVKIELDEIINELFDKLNKYILIELL